MSSDPKERKRFPVFETSEIIINQQASLEIFGNRQKSLELKKSFSLQIAA